MRTGFCDLLRQLAVGKLWPLYINGSLLAGALQATVAIFSVTFSLPTGHMTRVADMLSARRGESDSDTWAWQVD